MTKLQQDDVFEILQSGTSYIVRVSGWSADVDGLEPYVYESLVSQEELDQLVAQQALYEDDPQCFDPIEVQVIGILTYCPEISS